MHPAGALAFQSLQASSSLDLEKTKVMNLLKEGCWLSWCTTTLFGHQLEEALVKAKKLE